jgi:hypothetical protein
MTFNLGLHNGSTYLQRERREYRRIFAMAFAICFLGAIVDLFLPRQWRLLPQPAAACKPFLDHVNEQARVVTAFAFMG